MSRTTFFAKINRKYASFLHRWNNKHLAATIKRLQSKVNGWQQNQSRFLSGNLSTIWILPSFLLKNQKIQWNPNRYSISLSLEIPGEWYQIPIFTRAFLVSLARDVGSITKISFTIRFHIPSKVRESFLCLLCQESGTYIQAKTY